MLDQAIEFIVSDDHGMERVVAMRINGQDRIELPYESAIHVDAEAGKSPLTVNVTLFATSVRYVPDDR